MTLNNNLLTDDVCWSIEKEWFNPDDVGIQYEPSDLVNAEFWSWDDLGNEVICECKPMSEEELSDLINKI